MQHHSMDSLHYDEMLRVCHVLDNPVFMGGPLLWSCARMQHHFVDSLRCDLVLQERHVFDPFLVCNAGTASVSWAA